MLHSYSKPLNFGHRFLEGLMDGVLVVQEKIDGSQISFGIVENGDLSIRSRKQEIDPENPGMFAEGVKTVVTLYDAGKLKSGYIYRGEYLQKPKQNTLSYARVPTNNIILFDIDRGNQDYLWPDELLEEAASLGLETTPCYLRREGPVDLELLKGLLDQPSILGGVNIEGVVIKNYGVIGTDGKVMMGKVVAEDFRELHSSDWKKRNPNRTDIVDRIIADFGSEARWNKTIQHLTEVEMLLGEPKDIGPLMKELSEDFETECSSAIKDILWDHFRKQILKGISSGFPEYYKQVLAERVSDS